MSQFSQVLWAAFEQVLSTDLQRIGTLGSRELTELFRDIFKSRGNVAQHGIVGQYPAIAGVVATWTATVSGPIAGFMSDLTAATGDVSDYKVLRVASASTTITFDIPDAAGRIDLVVLNHNTVDSNVMVRNILTDPVARTVIPQNVAKDRDPVSTLSIVKGTAAASPQAPALAAGQMPLFAVYVPAAAVDAQDFSYSAASNVLTSSRSRGQEGMDSGGQIDTIRPVGAPFELGGASPSAAIAGTSGWPAAWIDGDLVRSFVAAASVPENDALASPFATLPALNGGAPIVGTAAVFGKAAYLYAYGGRLVPAAGDLRFVVSLTKPLPDGRPSSALRVAPYGAGGGTVDIQEGATFVAPVHYGNCDGAGGVPDLGGAGYVQQSWSGDSVHFPQPIAYWRGNPAGGGIQNLNTPALAGALLGVSTTLSLTLSDWLPEFSAGPTMATSLLVGCVIVGELAAGQRPSIGPATFVGPPNVSGTVTIMGGPRKQWRAALFIDVVTAATQAKYIANYERWVDVNNLSTLVAETYATNVITQPHGGGAAVWTVLSFEIGILGYKMNRMPRGRN
uniref:Uncharacterized protein n=1 Tax=viral metagenome TaxID=1070528 RepID=A0A6H1Z931_9ZZZZ